MDDDRKMKAQNHFCLIEVFPMLRKTFTHFDIPILNLQNVIVSSIECTRARARTAFATALGIYSNRKNFGWTERPRISYTKNFY